MRRNRFGITLAGLVFGASATAALFANPTTQPAGEAACAMAGGGSCPDGTMGPDTVLSSLFDRATAVTDIDNGLRFQFATQPGLLNDIAKVMDGSEENCRGLKATLAVDPSAGEVVLDLTGAPGTGQKLRKI